MMALRFLASLSTLMKPTPLYSWHLDHKARLTPFAGWAMPVQYTSVVEEHLAVRNRVGITDVSHMGRLVFRGPSAATFLGSVVTRRITDMKQGLVRYSLLTNERGGIIDDLVVGRFADRNGCGPEDEAFYAVVNAANHARDAAIFAAALPPDVSMTDVTVETAMLAIQGPDSVALLTEMLGVAVGEFRYYHGAFVDGRAAGIRSDILVKRTGYTGSDGFEIVVAADAGVAFAEHLFTAGRAMGIDVAPVGLAARDSLRIEAGMPLYGHEITEETTPFEAGLEKALFLTGLDFPGRDALVALESQVPHRVRVGLLLDDKRPAREGNAIVVAGDEVGVVTSGTFSPFLKRPIAMGFLPPSMAAVGTPVEINIRGHSATATVAKLPFYRRV